MQEIFQNPQQNLPVNVFAGVQPRNRSERGIDSEQIQQQRIRDRIGSYQQSTSGVPIQPAQQSPDFMPPSERFNKDFASYEKEQRALKNEKRNRDLERRRVETFDRDLKRWEYMEQQTQAAEHANEIKRQKYQIGKKGAGSQAFDIINAAYERSQRGNILASHENDRDVRSAIRMRQLELNNNASYDVVNGIPRNVPVVPQHQAYNPGPEYYPPMDLAGRPIRANSNQQYLVANQPIHYEPGKKQYQRNTTVGNTIPYNAPTTMPNSSMQQRAAQMMLAPPSNHYAGHPTIGLGQPIYETQNSNRMEQSRMQPQVDYQPNLNQQQMKQATINHMPTHPQGNQERTLIDGRAPEQQRSHEITGYAKSQAVPPTKPYAGIKAVPFNNGEVPEIKPFNHQYEPITRDFREVPQVNSNLKEAIQGNTVPTASIVSAPNQLLMSRRAQGGPTSAYSAPLLPIQQQQEQLYGGYQQPPGRTPQKQGPFPAYTEFDNNNMQNGQPAYQLNGNNQQNLGGRTPQNAPNPNQHAQQMYQAPQQQYNGGQTPHQQQQQMYGGPPPNQQGYQNY